MWDLNPGEVGASLRAPRLVFPSSWCRPAQRRSRFQSHRSELLALCASLSGLYPKPGLLRASAPRTPAVRAAHGRTLRGPGCPLEAGLATAAPLPVSPGLARLPRPCGKSGRDAALCTPLPPQPATQCPAGRHRWAGTSSRAPEPAVPTQAGLVARGGQERRSAVCQGRRAALAMARVLTHAPRVTSRSFYRTHWKPDPVPDRVVLLPLRRGLC